MLKGGDFIGYINSCKDYILYFFYIFCIFFEEEEFVRIIFRIEKVVSLFEGFCIVVKIVEIDEIVLGNDLYGNESKVLLVYGVFLLILF